MQRIKARAKINLALNVCGREGNAHLLDGVYVSVDLCDEVTLSARADDKIDVRYEGRDGIYENDTAYAMAKFLKERYGTPGVDVRIVKRIPEKRGLGGSSADAAGVARAFEAEFGLNKIDGRLLRRVGSDVPFQYAGGCARVRGGGEETSSVSLPKLFFAVLCPPGGVSTAECFSLYDRVGGDEGKIDLLLERLRKKKRPGFFNGLERAANILNGDVEVGKDILKRAGFSCGMTGSGSALFGTEYDESLFREKLTSVIVPSGFTLFTTETEDV